MESSSRRVNGKDALRCRRAWRHGEDHARRLGPRGDGGVVDLPPLKEVPRVRTHVRGVESLAWRRKGEVDVALGEQAGNEVVGGDRLDLHEVVDPRRGEVEGGEGRIEDLHQLEHLIGVRE